MSQTLTSDNQAQIDFWNGAASARWVQFQAALDHALDPFGVAAADALDLKPGQRVLDVGCGCGHSSAQLAQRVGAHGHVRGLDVSAPMLAQARTMFGARHPNLQFELGDAATQRFAARFERVYSRFGVMFFADPTRAFANLREATVSSAKLAFVCWRDLARNPWASLPLAWVREALPDAPEALPASGPGPYAFADPEHVTDVLAGAGFHDIALRSFEADVVFSVGGIEAATQFAAEASPAARVLQSANDAERRRALEVMAMRLSSHMQDGRVVLPGSAWLVTASSM